jgi:[ribosomal protein S18]-alanine N-acetyltransferase
VTDHVPSDGRHPTHNAASHRERYTLRYMRLEDIPQVVAIDRLSFPTPWDPNSYSFEIAQSNTSHMVILTTQQPRPPGLQGWWGYLRGQPMQTIAVGYAGMWYIAGEAHVSTIAVHPVWRGRGLGEVILNGLMQRAIMLGAEYSILEVRISNQPAQALYHKYGYLVIDTRPHYYRDNSEDAYIMHLDSLDIEYAARLHALTDQLAHRVIWDNQLATTDRSARNGTTNTPFSAMTSQKG